MDISQSPNLKPYRNYDENDVIDLFAHELASANKGSLVSIVTAEGNTNVWQNANSPATPHLDVFGQLSNTPTRAFSARYEVTWKVKNAASGETPLGLTLFDVREENVFGEKYIYRPREERYEQDIVVSGEAVPVVTRGIFKVNGFNGTPGPGSGASVTASGDDGTFDVTADPSAEGNIGKFLSTADADGYAIFKLEL